MAHVISTIEVDRPLTAGERAVLQWLLEHGERGNSPFLAQLPSARVVGLCACGCASIDLSIGGERPARSGMRVLSDYQWRTTEGHLSGAFVFERSGTLAGLELWSIDGQSTPDALPPIKALVPCGSPI